MLFEGQSLSLKSLDDGIAELCFDAHAEMINKFDWQTLQELEQALALLEQTEGVRGVLVTSAKNGFIAGADITQFATLFEKGDDELLGTVKQAAAIFSRVEDLPMPTVCAIQGAALGGGLEMALACDYRVAAQRAQLGLPEVKLGLCPGFGGTVRLPRLIGVDNAVEWIASGREMKAERALSDGAIDALVAPDQLRGAALDLLQRIIGGQFDHQSRRQEKRSPVRLNDIERLMAFVTGKAVVAAQAGPNMPAPVKAVTCMEKSAALGRDEALAAEAVCFLKLARTPQSQALIGLFLAEQALAKRNRQRVSGCTTTQQIAVLGAGIMGGGIAYQAAAKGLQVRMKDIAERGLQQGMAEANKLLSAQVAKGRLVPQAAGEALLRIRPQQDNQGFEQAQLVIEAVVENPRIKRQVLADVETLVSPTTILTSNTSTIRIDHLASALQHPERFCGMHFFNPVHRMPLVEVIQGEKSSESTVAQVVQLAVAMGKTPVVVRDCPGFFVNRVLFPYFAAFDLLVQGGVDFRRIDRLMERFGWPMGPAHLLDVVGIDTAHHAAGVMAAGFPDRLGQAQQGALERLFSQGWLGQKSGCGFYRYQNDPKGRPQKIANDEIDALLAEVVRRSDADISDEQIIDRLMLPMCFEVLRCLEEGIVQTLDEADLALIMGIGFPLFRGGAVRYMDQQGLASVLERARGYRALGSLYQVPEYLEQQVASGRNFYG